MRCDDLTVVVACESARALKYLVRAHEVERLEARKDHENYAPLAHFPSLLQSQDGVNDTYPTVRDIGGLSAERGAPERDLQPARRRGQFVAFASWAWLPVPASGEIIRLPPAFRLHCPGSEGAVTGLKQGVRGAVVSEEVPADTGSA